MYEASSDKRNFTTFATSRDAPKRPMGIVATPDGNFAYLTTGRGGKVVVIDTATDKSVAEIDTVATARVAR